MSEPVSIATGIAVRYAKAMFELASENAALPTVEADMDQLSAAIANSAEFRGLISSPLIARDAQLSAISALSGRMALSQITDNTLKLMATKGRLFVLPQLVEALKEMIAADRGEVRADVVAAEPLSDAQSARLAEVLAGVAGQGKTVKINTKIDESLIGGLVIKLGSKMIDTSISSKLARLGQSMKEVG